MIDKTKNDNKPVQEVKMIKAVPISGVSDTLALWLARLNYKASAENEIETHNALYEELNPKDPIEAMIISQIGALHELTMMSQSRANIERGNSFVKQPVYTQTTAKLSGAFIRLVETLNTYRGKQKTQYIRVEQVKIEQGANAVIGDVNMQEGGVKKNEF